MMVPQTVSLHAIHLSSSTAFVCSEQLLTYYLLYIPGADQAASVSPHDGKLGSSFNTGEKVSPINLKAYFEVEGRQKKSATGAENCPNSRLTALTEEKAKEEEDEAKGESKVQVDKANEDKLETLGGAVDTVEGKIETLRVTADAVEGKLETFGGTFEEKVGTIIEDKIEGLSAEVKGLKKLMSEVIAQNKKLMEYNEIMMELANQSGYKKVSMSPFHSFAHLVPLPPHSIPQTLPTCILGRIGMCRFCLFGTFFTPLIFIQELRIKRQKVLLGCVVVNQDAPGYILYRGVV